MYVCIYIYIHTHTHTHTQRAGFKQRKMIRHFLVNALQLRHTLRK